MARSFAGVRPTKRCPTDLGALLPDLGQPLYEIVHPRIAAAQAVPEQRNGGGVLRVLALDDRVWFKVKVRDQRGIVT